MLSYACSHGLGTRTYRDESHILKIANVHPEFKLQECKSALYTFEEREREVWFEVLLSSAYKPTRQGGTKHDQLSITHSDM